MISIKFNNRGRNHGNRERSLFADIMQVIVGAIGLSYLLLWLNNYYRFELFAQNLQKDELIQNVHTKPEISIKLASNIKLPHPIPPDSSFIKKTITKPDNDVSVLEISNKSRPSNETRVKELYKKISNGSGPEIQLSLPRSRIEQEYLITKLYQCLGIGLGKYSEGTITLVNDSSITGSRRSKMFRLVQGTLTEYENNITGLSNRGEAWVRLFPETTDMALIHGLIALTPDDIEIKNASGMYLINNNYLWINEITINGNNYKNNIRLDKIDCND